MLAEESFTFFLKYYTTLGLWKVKHLNSQYIYTSNALQLLLSARHSLEEGKRCCAPGGRLGKQNLFLSLPAQVDGGKEWGGN